MPLIATGRDGSSATVRDGSSATVRDGSSATVTPPPRGTPFSRPWLVGYIYPTNHGREKGVPRGGGVTVAEEPSRTVAEEPSRTVAEEPSRPVAIKGISNAFNAFPRGRPKVGSKDLAGNRGKFLKCHCSDS